MKPISILHLEDDPNDAELASEWLRSGGLDCRIKRVDSGAEFEGALDASGYDLILSDFALPAFDGLAALRMARRKAPYTPFVLFSGAIGEERAAEMIREGATDYVLKDGIARLPRAIERALTEARERAERDWAMAALKRALADKEALFAEVHHRVRNNFQIVSSLLRLHSERVKGADGAGLLTDLQARVRSMALVHDILYRTERSATLDFTGYARELCSELDSLYRSVERGIAIEVEGPSVPLSLGQAVPAGLLMHEIVAEALSRARPEGAARVCVRIEPAGDALAIEVSGEGTPAAVGDSREADLGVRLMTRLARQLAGEIAVAQTGSGTVTRVTFPIEDASEEADVSALARKLAAARD
jgi:two-component sensor histidine kinase/CheY-like chemotaxis protein